MSVVSFASKFGTGPTTYTRSDCRIEGLKAFAMTSTVLPPATANVPIARAMFPVPMMLMLLMKCPVLTDNRND